jgi:hypothetical protein
MDKLTLGQVFRSIHVSPVNSHSTNCSTFNNHPITDATLISILSYENKKCVFVFGLLSMYVCMCVGVKDASDFETTALYIKNKLKEKFKKCNG